MGRPDFSRVLVLGHTGYIGPRLFAALRSASPGVPVIGQSVRELDLTHAGSAPRLASLMEPDDVLVICAAIKKQLGDTPETFSQNMAIAVTLAKALETRPVKRIVFFSSAAVYGEDVDHGVIDERTPVEPTSYYGIAKFAAERLLVRAASASSLLILRPALVYGPGEPAYYYGPSGFLRKTLLGEPITLWGEGDEAREFVFVDDAVEIAKRLVFSGESGVVNVVSGTSYTYREAIAEVTAISGKAPDVTTKPRTKAKVDHRFDPAALRAALPNFAFSSLAMGLRRTAGAALTAGA